VQELTELNIRRCDGLMGTPGKGQKKGQEDQGILKDPPGDPPALVLLPSGSSLRALLIHHPAYVGFGMKNQHNSDRINTIWLRIRHSKLYHLSPPYPTNQASQKSRETHK